MVPFRACVEQRGKRMKAFGALILIMTAFAVRAADASQVIAEWLGHQTNIQTWAADFTQTRTLRTLTQPLISTGQVWFASPQNFRWELQKDRTIAIRNNETMLVLYP